MFNESNLNGDGSIDESVRSPSEDSGMTKTYRKIKDHNNKSGNSANHWPYLTLMDDLMADKPSITPVAVCSFTVKKKLYPKVVVEVAVVIIWIMKQTKKAKSTPASHSIAAFEDRSMKSEQNKERRFKDFMGFKAQKAEGLISTKNDL
ncbi:hypothetical protein WA026_021748 [Henosepilachna vigintioctopunctata]|uniref:Uncharacterized protein n=1 Tax=Henosepilachna vigintioctopunctata TaxID=420089 RepID=A0AAW1TR25_9CUCU